VDTRSDVYSLGVLLYELLTGTTPVEHKRLREAALVEVLRVVREEEPPKPSTRLTASAELPSIAACRDLEPKKLSGHVRGELDWIVMRALEKDRARRYQTASGLAADVQRYLHEEAVHASPPSAAYRFRKFARRNKRVLVTTSLVGVMFLVAIGGVAGSLGWAARDRTARRQAAERQAEFALRDGAGFIEHAKWPEALEAIKRAEGFLAGMPSRIDLGGRVVQLRRDVEMAIRLEDIWLRRHETGESHGEWRVRQLQSARVDREFAEAFRAFGIEMDALDPLEAGERIRASTIRLQLATALDGWKLIRNTNPEGNGDERRLYLAARHADPDPVRNRLRDAIVPETPELMKARLEAFAADEEVMAAPISIERLTAELAPLNREKAVVLLRKAQHRYPDNFNITYDLAKNLALLQPPRRVEAVRFMTAAVGIRPRSMIARRALAELLQDMREYDEAISVLRAALAFDPQDPFSRYLIGTLYDQKGAGDDAAAAYRAAVPAFRMLIRARPGDAEIRHVLGHALEGTGNVEEAIAEFRQTAKAGGSGEQCLSRQGAGAFGRNG
jgi:tetratricopeptide (TPR) repeat protein